MKNSRFSISESHFCDLWASKLCANKAKLCALKMKKTQQMLKQKKKLTDWQMFCVQGEMVNFVQLSFPVLVFLFMPALWRSHACALTVTCPRFGGHMHALWQSHARALAVACTRFDSRMHLKQSTCFNRSTKLDCCRDQRPERDRSKGIMKKKALRTDQDGRDGAENKLDGYLIWMERTSRDKVASGASKIL